VHFEKVKVLGERGRERNMKRENGRGRRWKQMRMKNWVREKKVGQWRAGGLTDSLG
jgi:hypothetical protein